MAVFMTVVLGLCACSPAQANETPASTGDLSPAASAAKVTRLAGPVALDTMRAIVDEGFPGSAKTVVLATDAGYWDALTASGVAGLGSAPVILTDGRALSSQARTELERLRPETVVVCGGVEAVPDAVSTAAADAAGTSPRVVRCAGADAAATACRLYEQAVSDLGKTWSDTAIVATGSGYWDALSIAPYAYTHACPVFLTQGDGRLSADTLAAMSAGGVRKAYVVGGTAVVSESVVAQLEGAGIELSGRLAGSNAIGTSEAVAEFELSQGMVADNLAVATSDGYWDALSGAALCGSRNSILVLASDADLSCVDGFVATNREGVSNAYVLGGTSAVSPSVYYAVVRALAGEGADTTPVALHGRLHVSGTSLVDANGEPFQVKGVSTHGLAWFPQFVNEPAFQTWRGWGANTVRLALYTAEYGGWCSGGDRSGLLGTLERGVDAATSSGMYAIVDWHILNDGNPLSHVEEAKAFFSTVAQRYPNQANVVYEICNEPNGGTTWDQIHDYASQVIPVIRAISPDAVIVVGTPTWSQDVDQVASKPLAFENVVYSLHFYAGTHKASLRDKAKTALAAGTPLLVSEFGITDASGNGSCDEASANEWVSFLDGNGIGYVCWSLSNKDESSALISSTCSKTSGWSLSDLSEEGRWYVGVLSGDTAATSGGSGSSGAGGTTAKGDAGGVGVSCSVESTWDSGAEHYALCRLTVSNTSSADVEGWKAAVTFASDVAVEQAWGASCGAAGTTVSVVPDEYASEVKAGTTQTGQVGFIVHGADAPSVVSVSVG